MNAFPNGTRVFFWTSNGDIEYASVVSSSKLPDGMQILVLKLESADKTAIFSSSSKTLIAPTSLQNGIMCSSSKEFTSSKQLDASLMLPNNPATAPDYTRASDAVLHPAGHPCGRGVLSGLRLLLAPTPSSKYDIERATQTPLRGSCCHVLETELSTPQIIENLSLEVLDKDSLPAMPTATVGTSLISDTTNPHYSQFNLVKWPSVSDGLPVHGEEPSDSHPNGEPTTTTLPWHSRALASLTLYGELSVACTPEEFALVRTRLQQEWSSNRGFLVAFAAVNAAMFAITTDSQFKINSYAYTAIATSSAACGLGIACDIWFLLRYDWVELEAFIYRSRDIFCVLVSSISIATFLGLIAFGASPVGVLVIVILVVLPMTTQFIMYGTHQFAASALRFWRAGAISIVDAAKRFQSFTYGG